MGLTSKRRTVERFRSRVSLIELCEAGRYREAQEVAEDLQEGDDETALGLAMVEIARGNHGRAKDLLTPLAFADGPLAGKAKVQLAVAYYYGGEAPEAKDVLKDAPEIFEKYLLKACIENDAPTSGEGRTTYALRLLDKAAKFKVRPALQGKLHGQRGLILRRDNKLDSAIQEYEAALYFFEQDQSDCIAHVVNNLAHVYFEFRLYDRALAYANRAVKLLKDNPPHLGQALDEKAQILLAQDKIDEASKASFEAVSNLRRADRKEWLVGALLTRARILRAADDDHESEAIREAEAISRYLNRDDLLIDVLRARTDSAEHRFRSEERRLLELALRVCGGKHRTVAKKLRTNHTQVRRMVERHKLNK